MAFLGFKAMKNLNETIWLIFKHCVTSVLIFAEFKVSFLKIQSLNINTQENRISSQKCYYYTIVNFNSMYTFNALKGKKPEEL